MAKNTKTPEQDQKLIAERLLELEGGLAIWKIGIDRLREQDKNARVLGTEKFKLLQKTIERDKRLESLPFVTPKTIDDREEFWVISGHHRTRAARMAGQQYVYCLVDETNLSLDKVKAKQLAHNAIQGEDDPQILQEIFESIEDLNEQIFAGVTAKDFLKDTSNVKIDEVGLEIETQVISLLFTEKGFKDFEDTLARVSDSEKIYLADFKYFDAFVEAARKTSLNENVRNITGIVLKMCEVVNKHYDLLEKEKKTQKVDEQD